jgi:3'-phosphoadenosine 5'-phosphosulfate sulfotransferase (PAPS reductase)/FAD synthetase
MTFEEKIDHAKRLIYAERAQCCVLYWSGGKDSTVLLHLIREVLPLNRLNCHGFPCSVIYHRQPWFPHKNAFADEIIRSWALEVYDFPPFRAGVKCKAERLELAVEYPFGRTRLHLPLNTEQPIPRRPYLCGRMWILRPRTALATYPWRVAFIGHKSSDVDPYEGAVPLGADSAENESDVKVVFPLRHWTDQDVWDYTEREHIPFDQRRYQERRPNPDVWDNPDFIHACTACIDPRESAPEVYCPKLKAGINNIGSQVARLEELPAYMKKE